MTNDSISSPRIFELDGAARTGQPRDDADERLFDGWFDPIESAARERVRSFIEELIESELETVLARPRYGRRAKDSDRGATLRAFLRILHALIRALATPSPLKHLLTSDS